MLAAAKKFPVEAGLGWGGIRPMVLYRVSDELVEWLVIIVLLHKSEWGLRPIGLLPCPCGFGREPYATSRLNGKSRTTGHTFMPSGAWGQRRSVETGCPS